MNFSRYSDRNRREILDSLYKAIEELEGRPVPRHRATSGFPFNLLENAINWVLDTLQRLMDKAVNAFLNWLQKKWRNRKKR